MTMWKWGMSEVARECVRPFGYLKRSVLFGGAMKCVARLLASPAIKVWKFWMTLTSVIAWVSRSIARRILPEQIYVLSWSLMWENLQDDQMKMYLKFLNLLNNFRANYLSPLFKFVEVRLREYRTAMCEEIELQVRDENEDEEKAQSLPLEGGMENNEEEVKDLESADIEDLSPDESFEKLLKEISNTVMASSSDDELDQLSPSDVEFSSGNEAMSSDRPNEKSLTGPELISLIIQQAEWYFSDEHLAEDHFILKHCRRRSDGYVSLKLIAGLRKVRQITRDFPTILAALRLSEKLEVDSEASKIRRREPLPPELRAVRITARNRKCRQRGNKETVESANSTDSAQASPPSSPTLRTPYPGGRNRVARSGHFSASEMHTDGMDFKRDASEVTYRHRSVSPPSPTTSVTYWPVEPSSIYRTTSQQQKSNGNRAVRPKSMALGEKLTVEGMSPWLIRRKAAAEGHSAISTVIRQPKGPDGTRGFVSSSTCIHAH